MSSHSIFGMVVQIFMENSSANEQCLKLVQELSEQLRIVRQDVDKLREWKRRIDCVEESKRKQDEKNWNDHLQYLERQKSSPKDWGRLNMCRIV